jgi:hypothetical protein
VSGAVVFTFGGGFIELAKARPRSAATKGVANPSAKRPDCPSGSLKRVPALYRNIQFSHKNKRIRRFIQDDARIGPKGPRPAF